MRPIASFSSLLIVPLQILRTYKPLAVTLAATLATTVCLSMFTGLGLAQPVRTATDAVYPVKPVRLVIPFAAGGSNDVAARILSQKLGQRWNQQVVSDNRVGANGIIGSELVAHAAPDGYTLLIVSTTFTMNPSLYSLPFQPERDFAGVSLIAEGPLVLCTHSSFAANSVEQLISLARARPGQFTFASAGAGGIAHLAGVLFERTAGVRLLHVPYKGSSAGVIDVMSGQVTLIFSSVSPVLPFLQNGRLRALGIGSLKRSPLLSATPTIAESGAPGYESNMWWGVAAPRLTPAPRIDAINRGIRLALEQADARKQFENLGMDARVSTPLELSQLITSDIRKWAGVIKDARLNLATP